VRGDVAEGMQPPDISMRLMPALQPIMAGLQNGYRIETAADLEEAGKANAALGAVFPLMLILMLIVIMFQVRSMAAMAMVLLTAPLALVGVVPTLLLFNQPFGFNAILGLIGLAGIIMRNTLILVGQIHSNERDGLTPFRAVVEATVQRSRPVILTALAAVLAFIPLTFSVFWGSLAYTLIGGTIGGTVLTLVFLPALYAIWFKIKPPTNEDPVSADVPAADGQVAA
jgi:multidrug efflux pump subunit AcrB